MIFTCYLFGILPFKRFCCFFVFFVLFFLMCPEHQITGVQSSSLCAFLAWESTLSAEPFSLRRCILPAELCKAEAGGHSKNNPLRCIRKYSGIPDLPANGKLCIAELEVGPDALNSQIQQPRLCHVLVSSRVNMKAWPWILMPHFSPLWSKLFLPSMLFFLASGRIFGCIVPEALKSFKCDTKKCYFDM